MKKSKAFFFFFFFFFFFSFALLCCCVVRVVCACVRVADSDCVLGRLGRVSIASRRRVSRHARRLSLRARRDRQRRDSHVCWRQLCNARDGGRVCSSLHLMWFYCACFCVLVFVPFSRNAPCVCYMCVFVISRFFSSQTPRLALAFCRLLQISFCIMMADSNEFVCAKEKKSRLQSKSQAKHTSHSFCV